MSDDKTCRVKCKNMMYTQQLELLPAKNIEKLTELLEKIAPKRYALIVHDKDVNDNGEPAKDHVHVMLSFENARSINSIAKKLGDEPQYIEMWTKNEGNGYSYLIHITKNAVNKHQYSPEEVTANFDYKKEIQKITEEIERKTKAANTRFLLNALYNGEITKENLEKKLSGSQYGMLKNQIENVWSKHLQFQAAKWREEMKKSGKQIKVIWISGEAGTGKTSLAKDYAEKTKKPYFITGSSRDLFQNYSGEHTIIIDELRADMMRYPDLLRILDPFGRQVMAPSRYSDKPLACDLILITSPYDPAQFYHMTFMCTIDGLEQLLRRITLTIKMDATHIRAVEYNRKKETYRTVKNGKKENRYSKKFREKDKPGKESSDSKNLFESMFAEAPHEENGSSDSVEKGGENEKD